MQNFSFEHNGKTLWYSRSLAVSCLVYSKDNAGNLCILANKRGSGCEFNKGLWNVPGGFIDFNETSEEAASRELFEETGVQIQPTDWIFAELDTKYKQSARQTIIARYIIFVDYDIESEFTTEHSEPDEVEDIRWIKVSELDKYQWTKRQIEPILKYGKNFEVWKRLLKK